ncbi:DUF4229 domain-containing protein [Trujillonella humicola]|uniref:DUF4229 domain-containing protein n=1 Tax=Trujillonella humicola TaxID=3383699 RepID=UPI003906B2D6
MAEPTDRTTDPATPGSPTGGPATPPRVAPPLVLYTLGRLLITVALVALIWVAGLPGFPALLFGLLLSMPAAHFLLRGVRERLTEALAARGVARRAAKEDLRARLSGDADDDV